MVGDAEIDDRLHPEEADWRTFIKRLPPKVDLQAMITDMKETFKSEVAVMRAAIKAVMGRVDQVDCLNWAFMFEVLQSFGFKDPFITALMGLYSSPSATICLPQALPSLF